MNKAWLTAQLCATWFTEYFKTTAETYCRKKDSTLLFINIALGHPRALAEIYIKIKVVFMPANPTSIYSTAHGSRSHFDFHVLLRNTFCKVIAASYGSVQRKLKIFWKDAILDAIKNICDSWEEVKIAT